MAEDPIPKARTVLTFRQRVMLVLPGAFLAVLLVGLLGGAVFGLYSCTKAETERKTRECKALASRLDRVERIVRETGLLRAYVREPETNRLLEYRFPADSGPYGTVIFYADVPADGPLRIVSTSVLEPNEQCVETVEVHVRSARDIE